MSGSPEQTPFTLYHNDSTIATLQRLDGVFENDVNGMPLDEVLAQVVFDLQEQSGITVQFSGTMPAPNALEVHTVEATPWPEIAEPVVKVLTEVFTAWYDQPAQVTAVHVDS